MVHILKMQIREREEAIGVFERVGKVERANELREEIALLEPYLNVSGQ